MAGCEKLFCAYHGATMRYVSGAKKLHDVAKRTESRHFWAFSTGEQWRARTNSCCLRNNPRNALLSQHQSLVRLLYRLSRSTKFFSHRDATDNDHAAPFPVSISERSKHPLSSLCNSGDIVRWYLSRIKLARYRKTGMIYLLEILGTWFPQRTKLNGQFYECRFKIHSLKPNNRVLERSETHLICLNFKTVSSIQSASESRDQFLERPTIPHTNVFNELKFPNRRREREKTSLANEVAIQ